MAGGLPSAVYTVIQSVIDGVTATAARMERKWGVGRLRLLVPHEWRVRFDEQHAKWHAAIDSREVYEAELHGAAMERAWLKLDQVATEAKAQPISPEVWEIALPSGGVVAFARTVADGIAHRQRCDGRQVIVWTPEELGRLIDQTPSLLQTCKEVFEGAVVEAVRQPTINWAYGDAIPELGA